ncbi:hypothetical protein [Burkholderia sp. Tr-20390]|uniref:hypothetical protein n=1 Tax=Burkholderia sp. Tr-20390 TaxID=2703904 RepID=UPI001F1211A5|nr:hypothetical protein [Burkholderia sp. Tr-20390]
MMPVQPPPFGDVLASVLYLVILLSVTRFALRWFLGVRALQRKCERQAFMLDLMAKRQGIELPAEVPRADRLACVRRAAGRARARIREVSSLLASKVR